MPLLHHPVQRRWTLLRASIPVAALALGCEATGPRPPASVSLSVASPSPATSVGTGPNSLRITKVEFVLAETELADAGSRDALQLNPILIDLPLGTATPRKVINATVSAGRYTTLETRLRAGGLETLHPDWPADMSVRVAGVYTDANGATHDFTFTSAADAQIQIAFARPITVDAARNVTLAANVTRWFRNGTGAVLDPRNSANAAAINANISGSFEAFQDDNEDGVEDDPSENDDEDSTEVEDDTTEVDDEENDEHEDTTEVEDDTTEVEPSAIRSLLFRQQAGSPR